MTVHYGHSSLDFSILLRHADRMAINQASREECDRLLTDLYAELRDEVTQMRSKVTAHCDAFRRKGFTGENSSSMEDCIVLYMLARKFSCQHAFEVGTFIGTTAVAMNEAARRNGGVFTTCDPVDFAVLPPWSGIRFIQGTSEVALYVLRSEASVVDFCFFDWKPEGETIHLMRDVCPSRTILCVHDYGTAIKGNEIVDLLNAEYHNAHSGKWFLPGPSPVVMPDGTPVNVCTAFFIPTELHS